MHTAYKMQLFIYADDANTTTVRCGCCFDVQYDGESASLTVFLWYGIVVHIIVEICHMKRIAHPAEK